MHVVLALVLSCCKIYAQLPFCVDAAERNHGVDEQDFLAVVHAIGAWHCCFEGGER